MAPSRLQGIFLPLLVGFLVAAPAKGASMKRFTSSGKRKPPPTARGGLKPPSNYQIVNQDPAGIGRPYAQLGQNATTIYNPGGKPMSDYTLKHELGHLYDGQNLTPFERQGIQQQVLANNQPWYDTTLTNQQLAAGANMANPSPAELFADAYSYLLRNRSRVSPPDGKPHRRVTGGYNGGVPLSKLEMLRSWLVNRDRVIRDAEGRPVAFRPEYLKK